MKIVDMTVEHLRTIKVREMERIDLGDNFKEVFGENYLSSEFKKAVLTDEGEIVFLFGGKHMGQGGWVWLLATDLLYQNPVASMEMILKLHEDAKEVHPDIKFYYTYNNPDFPIAIRFLERLGYKQKWMTDDFQDKKERILLVKEMT